MDAQENRSDVARLRQRIAEEYEAATRGLSGLAYGTAKHEFITRRMEQMVACHETLKQLVELLHLRKTVKVALHLTYHRQRQPPQASMRSVVKHYRRP